MAFSETSVGGKEWGGGGGGGSSRNDIVFLSAWVNGVRQQ